MGRPFQYVQYVFSGQITTESENNLSKIRFFGEIITRKLLVFSYKPS
jgi:hypothetical protein